MVILFATVMTGLAWSSSGRSRPELGIEADEVPDAGIIVRSEVLHLWLPETLGKVTSPKCQAQIIRDHEDLRRVLEHRHQENPKYAVTVRGHQVNGGYGDITFVRHPYEDPRCFQEFLDLLAGVGGRRDCDTAADFPGTSVHIIPEELLNREPSEILAELQRILDDEGRASRAQIQGFDSSRP
jgi:hypothetical protein